MQVEIQDSQNRLSLDHWKQQKNVTKEKVLE